MRPTYYAINRNRPSYKSALFFFHLLAYNFFKLQISHSEIVYYSNSEKIQFITIETDCSFRKNNREETVNFELYFTQYLLQFKGK